MNLSEIWQRITTTRTSRALEAFARLESALREEIARLRAENRALLNSILGIAGVPPIPIKHETFAAPQSAAPVTPRAAGQIGAPAAVPMRRRSWHQINRLLEFDSAKKKSPETIS